MQLQGSAYITEDLDFCYARSARNFHRLAKALEPYHPHLRNVPEELPFRFDAGTIERGLNFILATDLGALDFLGEVAGLGAYESVKAASDIMSVFGINHQVLSVAGLIQAKRAAGRDKDLQALKELEGLLDFRKRSGL